MPGLLGSPGSRLSFSTKLYRMQQNMDLNYLTDMLRSFAAHKTGALKV